VSAKEIRQPGPDHPISISPTGGRVTVTVAGARVADSVRAVTLKEATYPAVQYVPRADVDLSQLQRSSRRTYCPYKGDCTYYSIVAGGERSIDAVWSYESPHAAVAEIKDYMAFYPNRVDAITVSPPA